MRNGVISELVRTVSRFAIIGVVGGMAAACSTDAVRLSGSPFSNPFSASGDADPHQTGSVNAGAPAAMAPMPRGSVQSAPLAPPNGRSAAGAPGYNQPAPVPTRLAAGRGGRMVPGWRLEGGTPVTVGPGDTVETISSRYGVPATAILSANGISSGQVVPGRQVVIPVYTVSRAAAPQPVAAQQPRLAAAAPVQNGQVVGRTKLADVRAAKTESLQPRSLGDQARDTQPRLGHGRREMSAVAQPQPQPLPVRMAAAEPRRTGTVDAKTAHPRPGRVAGGQPLPVRTAEHKAADLRSEKAPSVGKVVKTEPLPLVKEKLARVARAEAAAKPEKVAEAPAKSAKAAPLKVAAAEPARVAAPEPAKAAPAPAREVEATASLPAQPAASSADFRWPARGRVISGFGSGGSNEGINIAVPDGTPVKAAEAGTVAYAGSEVKGYGNLVLIRHDNGYVSAYAHNGELDVKRGQRVTRGQLIAKSGQSGNVTSPQIHFEIRKGATPVDPMPYLASN